MVDPDKCKESMLSLVEMARAESKKILSRLTEDQIEKYKGIDLAELRSQLESLEERHEVNESLKAIFAVQRFRAALSIREIIKYIDQMGGALSKLTLEYHVPGHGPSNNRYDRLQLDEWMMPPRCFMIQRVQQQSRRVPGTFTPVTI